MKLCNAVLSLFTIHEVSALWNQLGQISRRVSIETETATRGRVEEAKSSDEATEDDPPLITTSSRHFTMYIYLSLFFDSMREKEKKELKHVFTPENRLTLHCVLTYMMMHCNPDKTNHRL